MWFRRVLCWCFIVYFINCDSEETYRLSTKAIPIQYNLTIIPDFNNNTFHGEVAIHVNTKEELASITLHSANLTITEVEINDEKALFKEKPYYETIEVFYEGKNIQPGFNVIKISYSGFFATNNGFIRAFYENGNETVFLYVTDLEATYARTVFPCFDEPSFKAIFKITLISPNEKYTAIANMPEINKSQTSDGSVIYEFEPSVKMSPYLLSFAFTEPQYTYYENVIQIGDKHLPVRIHTVNASKENNEYTFNCTRAALKFYSDYTGISYPLDKLDMIEYKRSLTAATENWGLITFRQGLLTPSLKLYNKYQVKLVVFHELGHFWFGNLVTNKWWSDLWLQEGFATYFSYKLLSIDNGKTTVADEMRSFSFNDYFDNDIYQDKPPIVPENLMSVADIESVFNDIVYYKSAAILLMLEEVIGEEAFRSVIRKFLKKYEYSVASTEDFLNVLEEEVKDKPVRDFLESYLSQRRFPVISVDADINSTYTFTQEPSIVINNQLETTPRNEDNWTVPIRYLTDSGNVSTFWFDKNTDYASLYLPDAKWVIFNPGGMGVYRINYSDKIWTNIIANYKDMPVPTTEAIASDLLYGTRTNKISCDIDIKMMKSLTKSQRRKWGYFYSVIFYIKDNLYCSGYKEEEKLFRSFLKRKLQETGFISLEFLLPLEVDCESKYTQNSKITKQMSSKCAKWIKQFLKEKDSNLID